VKVGSQLPILLRLAQCVLSSETYVANLGETLLITGMSVPPWDEYLVTLPSGTWNIYTNDDCGILKPSYLSVLVPRSPDEMTDCFFVCYFDSCP
jgi:hypothetical protein